MLFETNYGFYNTQVYARDHDHLYEVLKQRGLGERLKFPSTEHPEFVSELVTQWRWIDALHTASWMGMIATASGVVTGFQLLKDEGLIHQLSHVLWEEGRFPDAETFIHSQGQDIKEIIHFCYEESVRIEQLIPGFLPATFEDTSMRKHFGRWAPIRNGSRFIPLPIAGVPAPL